MTSFSVQYLRKQTGYQIEILRHLGFLYCDVKEVASGLFKMASEKGLRPGWVTTDSKTSVDSLLANRLYTQQRQGLETTQNIMYAIRFLSFTPLLVDE